MINLKRTNIKIEANPVRVIPRYLRFKDTDRIKRIISDVVSLDESIVEETLKGVFEEFENRHIGFLDIIMDNFQVIEQHVPSLTALSPSKKLLIGSYFTSEYSVESAALFNPSIVLHPDQSGLQKGEVRFVLSLRATGEGHISSIEFTSGIISREGEITMDPRPAKLVCAKVSGDRKYSQDFIAKRAGYYEEFNTSLLEHLPVHFSMVEADQVIRDLEKKVQEDYSETKAALHDIFETNYEVFFDKQSELGSRVIFPVSKAESGGMEDVRFVEFSDRGKTTYLGTYTAYDGKKIRPKLIETSDFISFNIRSLYGKAALDKGMALFPEKIDGKYAMISRQGAENISIMYSEDLYCWDVYKTIQKPQRNWELTQIGNCGSPVKTSSGWFLLTHAVGPMRKYMMGASLLDLRNPEIVLATLDKPLLSANQDEREGYVPNVVYTCGYLPHFEQMIVPYAMSDIAISFASFNIKMLIDKLLNKK